MYTHMFLRLEQSRKKKNHIEDDIENSLPDLKKSISSAQNKTVSPKLFEMRVSINPTDKVTSNFFLDEIPI